MITTLRANTKNLKNVEIYPLALGTENKFIKLGNNSVKAKGFMATESNFILDQNNSNGTKADIEFECCYVE